MWNLCDLCASVFQEERKIPNARILQPSSRAEIARIPIVDGLAVGRMLEVASRSSTRPAHCDASAIETTRHESAGRTHTVRRISGVTIPADRVAGG